VVEGADSVASSSSIGAPPWLGLESTSDGEEKDDTDTGSRGKWQLGWLLQVAELRRGRDGRAMPSKHRYTSKPDERDESRNTTDTVAKGKKNIQTIEVHQARF
jgi:hypothetical protein